VDGGGLERLCVGRELCQRVKLEPVGSGRIQREEAGVQELLEQSGSVTAWYRFDEGPPEIRDGAVGVGARHGVGGRAAETLHHPRVTGRLGTQQLRGHALRARFALGEHARRAGVPDRALARRQPLVHRCPDERVHEVERELGFKDRDGGKRIGRPRGFTLLEFSQRGRFAHGHIRPEDRYPPRQRGRASRQPCQSNHQRSGHRFRNVLAHHGRRRRRGFDAFVHQRPRELLQKKWIPSAHRMTGRAELVVRSCPEHPPYEHLGALPTERCQSHHAADRLPGDACKRLLAPRGSPGRLATSSATGRPSTRRAR
jgi:hypothetical protein